MPEFVHRAVDFVADKVQQVADYAIAKAFGFWLWLGKVLDVRIVTPVPRPWVIFKDDAELQAVAAGLREEISLLNEKARGLEGELRDVKYARAVALSDSLQLKDSLAFAHAENRELRDKLDRVSANFGQGLFGDKPFTTGPERPNRKKLTQREVAEIREMKRNGWKNVDIANAFDVNRATISRIVRGQYHKAAA